MPKFIIITWINRPQQSTDIGIEEVDAVDFNDAYDAAMIKLEQTSGHRYGFVRVIELSKGWTLSIPIKLTWRERLRGWFNPLSRKHL